MLDGRDQEIPCESCGEDILVRTLETPEGLPDFITAMYPDGAWLGWIWPVSTFGKLGIIGLCSHSCMVAWTACNVPTKPPPPE